MDAINNKLTQIQNGLTSTVNIILTPKASDSLSDRNNIDALRNCINTIVANGGRKTADDGTCLSTSGFSLESLRQQFRDFTDMNDFLAPAAAITKVVDDVNAYLDSVVLVPATETLIAAAAESINNVVKTVAALDVQATNKAFDCFLEALQVGLRVLDFPGRSLSDSSF